MAANFLICGTGPRTGKTMAGCAIAFALKVRGLRAGVMKPVETGCAARDGALIAADAEALRAAASCDQPLDRINLYRYRSPLAPIAAANADGSAPPGYDAITGALGQIRAASDVVIVEEAHRLDAPLGGSHDYASLAAAFSLELILIIANRDRFIDEALQILEYAHSQRLTVRGVILNSLDPASSATINDDANRLTRSLQPPLLGTVRYREPLSLAIVQRLL